jgi:rubrerythrin
MPTIHDLEQSEIDAVNLYTEFLRQHNSQLTSKDIKRIKSIITDEKDHLRIDKQISKEHR